jgi:Arrestin (or S-antigen), C-terminal domain
MGAVNQKSTASINLKSRTVLAGEDVVGSVHVCLSQPVQNPKVLLELFGGEKFIYIMGGECDWYNNEIKYPKVEGVLFTGESLEPGHYSFPFALSTLKTMPGSMKSFDNYHKASISYYLQVTVLGDSNFLLKSQQDLTVQQKFDSKKHTIKNHSKSELKYFNFFSRGTSKLQVEMKNYTFHPGDTAEMKIIVDNLHSELNMKSINIALHRIVSLEYSEGNAAHRDQLISNNSTPVNIPHGEKHLSNKNVHVSFAIQIKKDFLKGCGTTKGKIIESKYVLEVSASFGTFASNIKTIVPIIILPKKKFVNKEPGLVEMKKMSLSTFTMN